METLFFVSVIASDGVQIHIVSNLVQTHAVSPTHA